MKIPFLLLSLLSALPALPALAQQTPVVTDSRIKTLVYNENDVYPLLTHYGYQANIEFGPKERVETLSVGDRVGWQIIPAGRRLFVRPLEEGAHTNMTVITSLHTYQFDLKSSLGGEMKPNEELVYVVRFYYPEDDLTHYPSPQLSPTYASQSYSQAAAPADAAPMQAAPTYSQAPVPAVQTAPAEMERTPVQPAPPQSKRSFFSGTSASTYNYRYTFSGPDRLAPQKIYDDGQSTFLQLTSAPNSVGLITPDGKELPIRVDAAPERTYRAGIVGHRLLLHYGSDTVSVYNEAY